MEGNPVSWQRGRASGWRRLPERQEGGRECGEVFSALGGKLRHSGSSVS